MMVTWAFSSDDNCTDHFTPNQVARMHCYLDLVYQKWLTEQRPAPIPLAPIVTDHSPDSVSIYWVAPIRGLLYQRYDFMGSFATIRLIVTTEGKGKQQVFLVKQRPGRLGRIPTDKNK